MAKELTAAEEKSRRVDRLLAKINERAADGERMIARLGDTPMEVETISSGSLVLDQKLGGGLGKGRIIEIYGAESSGKTTIALTAIANVQRNGGTAVFVDAEFALDPSYAKKLGVDVESLIVAQPGSAEAVLNLVNILVSSKVVDIIVVDSVAAMTPMAELEGDAEDMTIGLLARLLAKELRKLLKPTAENGTTVIFLNQVRDQIGGFSPRGTPQTTPGGKALKFYASQRIKLSKGMPITEGSGEKRIALGTEMKFKVEKNKIAPPFRTGSTVLSYAKGINMAAELIEVGPDAGVIERKGRTYIEVATGEVLTKNSKADAITALEANPEMFDRLRAALKDSLMRQDAADNGELADDQGDAEDAELAALLGAEGGTADEPTADKE